MTNNYYGSTVVTIMIVDDVPANLNLLREILKDCGYHILAFPSGKMALHAALQHAPHLILLDAHMPDMDGFEVCRQLKSYRELRNVPVIFINDLGNEIDKVKVFAIGGVDYVTKPFQFAEIQARVAAHLRLRSLQFALEQHNSNLEHLVQEKIREISESQLAIISALAKLASSRDDDAGFHIERTSTFCKILAEQLHDDSCYSDSINPIFIEHIYHAAPLHDVGKVGLPDHILLKPSKLTPEEFAIMKTHTILGAKALQSVQIQYPQNNFINMGIAIAQAHHEKWDGSGYPARLAGAAIPLEARIMALADVYDALRSKRHYKKPFSHAISCEIINEGSGKHFDPVLIDAFGVIESKFARIRNEMDD